MRAPPRYCEAMRWDAAFRAADHVVAKLVGEELVLLDYEGEVYYGLDPVGARIWELLAAGRTLGEIIDTLLAEYDVTRDQLAADVERVVGELESNGLLRTNDR